MSAPRYKVGDKLPNGATVLVDNLVTAPDGTTTEFVQDSHGNESTTIIPPETTEAEHVGTVIVKAADLDTVQTSLDALLTSKPFADPQIQTLANLVTALAKVLVSS